MYPLKSCMLVHIFLLFPWSSDSLDSFSSFNSSVNHDQSWYNNDIMNSTHYLDYNGSKIGPIVLGSTNDYTSVGIAFGFFNNRSSDATNKNYYLVIRLIPFDSFRDYPLIIRDNPVVVWCANRDKPVRENATLHFTAKGGLELVDVDGTLVWSTNNSGAMITRMQISTEGNLMLLDGKGNVIWQSFDYPTDTWLPNQNLPSFKALTSSNSSSNLDTGIYSLTVRPNDGFVAYINSDPTQIYMSLQPGAYEMYYLGFNTSIEQFSNSALFKVHKTPNYFPYIKLEPTGHLYMYELPNYRIDQSVSETASRDLFAEVSGGSCSYPTVCGAYGVCSGNELCSCPGGNSSYFRQSQDWQPNLGCTPVTPLSCTRKHLHTFLELNKVTYFSFITLSSEMDRESCKSACLNNCSCKAAFFSSGNCSLSSQLYSLKYDAESSSLAFIKVQKQAMQEQIKSTLIAVLVSALSIGVLIILFASCYCYKMRANSNGNSEEEGDDQVIGALRRFSFLELKSATRDFQVKLGQGGFGSVFEGNLADGSKVAVKRLDSLGQGTKEFLAEVNTIGSINHFNLVKLIGFCTEKSTRLLVYEHLKMGSLDKWIFRPESARNLVWDARKKIIIGLARGLEYLHVHCNPSIIHFDVKPQNILLDGDFNVKISDFGLAKLIDRDQSQVLTALKGTPGYMAPELFSGTNISVKADVFSFGVVLLEIIFGRKNSDSTQSCPLIIEVKEKANNDQLQDLVYGYIEGIESENEVVKMIKIGVLCLQDHKRRPSMSTILKVLEGLVELENVAEFSSLTMPISESHVMSNSVLSTNSAPRDASILSGPR